MDITFTNYSVIRDISFNEDGEDAWNDNIQRPDYYSSISAEIISLRDQTDASLSAFFSSIYPLIPNSNLSYSLKIEGELTELSNNIFTFKNLITDMEKGTPITLIYDITITSDNTITYTDDTTSGWNFVDNTLWEDDTDDINATDTNTVTLDSDNEIYVELTGWTHKRDYHRGYSYNGTDDTVSSAVITGLIPNKNYTVEIYQVFLNTTWDKTGWQRLRIPINHIVNQDKYDITTDYAYINVYQTNEWLDENSPGYSWSDTFFSDANGKIELTFIGSKGTHVDALPNLTDPNSSKFADLPTGGDSVMGSGGNGNNPTPTNNDDWASYSVAQIILSALNVQAVPEIIIPADSYYFSDIATIFSNELGINVTYNDTPYDKLVFDITSDIILSGLSLAIFTLADKTLTSIDNELLFYLESEPEPEPEANDDAGVVADNNADDDAVDEVVYPEVVYSEPEPEPEVESSFTDISFLTTSTIVNVVSSDDGNKYVFNNGDSYDDTIQYGLNNGSYVFYDISENHPMTILSTDISYSVDDSNIIEIYVDKLSSYSPPFYQFYTSSSKEKEIILNDGTFRFMRGKTYKFIAQDIYDEFFAYDFEIYNVIEDQKSHSIVNTGESITITFPDNTINGDFQYRRAQDGSQSVNLWFLYDTIDSTEYNFYYGNINVDISGDFNTASIHSYEDGYMGGENLLIYQITYNTPYNFSTIKTQSFTPSLSSLSSFDNLDRVLISPDSGTTFLSIDDSFDLVFVDSTSLTTYDAILKATFQLVEENNNVNSGYYRLDSEMHSMYSLDIVDNSLCFNNAWDFYRDGSVGSKWDVSGGYVLFEITDTSLNPFTRYEYDESRYNLSNDPEWTDDTVFSEDNTVVNTSYDLSYSSDTGKITYVDSTLTNTTFSFFEETSLVLTIPDSFNPDSSDYTDNSMILWETVNPSSYDSNNFVGGSSSNLYNELSGNYQSQIATMGNDSTTATEAETMLDAIFDTGTSIRYDKELYTAFRTAILNTTLQSYTIVNAPLDAPTAPYVYFTNEMSGNDYHPFMVIASHSIADKPNRLIDVTKPPGEADVDYLEANVTRTATIMNYLIKIPMRDYGEVDNLLDNDLSNNTSDGTNLLDDYIEKIDNTYSSDYSVYNYASISSVGIAIDGVLIYPLLNNVLMPAQEKAEITNTGIHVGQGMGLHLHSDGHGATGNGLNLYNLPDYVGNDHPPLIGFGFDGIALYGKYETSYSSMDGYSDSLDEYGGHEHGNYGYHYHAHSVDSDVAGVSSLDPSYTCHILMKGAWKGIIADIPYFWNSSSQQPNVTDSENNNKYAGFDVSD